MSSSPIRCRGTWKIHKRPSEPDRWLEEMGFFRKHTARDASCLFRAVSEAVFHTQRYFHRTRLECVRFMGENRQLFEGSLKCTFENYLEEMTNPLEHGGLVEITAMSHLYRRDFIIFEANKGPLTKICHGYGNTVFLFYSPDTKHFDVVYTKEYLNNTSFCQSLVYEMLYDGVYQLKDLPYAVDRMLHDKVSNHIEYFMSENVERRRKKAKIETTNTTEEKPGNVLALKCKHHPSDVQKTSLQKESLSIFVFNRSLVQLENVCLNCLNANSAKDLLANGITPFPYKVAKALDPDIYRNIEFDVWSDMRRELRFGARFSDGVTLQVGVKCLCRLEANQATPYHCHIQEMCPDGGPCLVFIEELGEKRVVKLEQLEPLPLDQVRPWAPPYRFARANSHFLSLSQMLQQIGNITRKQGAGKARKVKPLEEPPKSPEKPPIPVEEPLKSWSEEVEASEATDLAYAPLDQLNFDFAAYQNLDMFYPAMPVEIQALPLMVDCRPGAGELPAHNGDAHHNNSRNNEMGGPLPPAAAPPAPPAPGPAAASPAARATTPANNAITTYAGAMNPYNPGLAALAGGAPCYVPCGVKSVVWCAPPPPPHAPPPPPPHVNPHVYKSMQANGSDLPMNDIATLRFFFNLGLDCMWAAYGAPPPRHYSPRDLAQDMQQVSIQERPPAHEHGKHKPPPDTKPPPGKPAQRPLLGPRFKRGGNQDGQNNHNNHNNHNNNNHNNHNNKQHNNMANRGPHNRRNSTGANNGPPAQAPPAPAAAPPAMEQPPYLAYPPPVYPVYYPMEGDPAMMGMLGGAAPGPLGYYEEAEYPLHYLPPYPPPHLPDHNIY